VNTYTKGSRLRLKSTASSRHKIHTVPTYLEYVLYVFQSQLVVQEQDGVEGGIVFDFGMCKTYYYFVLPHLTRHIGPEISDRQSCLSLYYAP
jgi:hypothetical protein